MRRVAALILLAAPASAARPRSPGGAAGGGPPDYPMVWVGPGSFQMGSPEGEAGRDDDEARRAVTLTRGLWIGRTEVPQALWAAVMGHNPSAPAHEGLTLLGDPLPVQQVSWCDAVAFANRLSARDGLPPAYAGVEACAGSRGASVTWDRASRGYRLPTEAEWEHAARAGADGPFAGGAGAQEVCAQANVLNPSAPAAVGAERFACEDGHAGPAPVGSFAANAHGIHDLTGNVWEWCWDGAGDAAGGVDPVSAAAGAHRVNRGGAWTSGPRQARVANRVGNPAGDRLFDLGLRLVRAGP